MRRLAAAVCLGVAAAVLLWTGRTADRPRAAPVETDGGWIALDAQARCDSAVALVSHPDRWPLRCRWRDPSEQVQGQAYPPPPGPPPFDQPRVEIYVEAAQTREELAAAIAHELGHMHHTREPAFVAQWLEARGLPADTPSETWTEDYAEVFAVLFGPPSEGWRAPTRPPPPEALAALKSEFFS